jgi:hypothetical protein
MLKSKIDKKRIVMGRPKRPDAEVKDDEKRSRWDKKVCSAQEAGLDSSGSSGGAIPMEMMMMMDELITWESCGTVGIGTLLMEVMSMCN